MEKKASRAANGDGSVYYSQSKKIWVGQISLGYDENGKIRRKTVYGKTKTEVKQKLKQIEVGVYTGTFLDKDNITIYQLCKQILDDDLNCGDINENTYRTNLDTLKRLKEIYNIPLQKATEMLLKDFLLKEQSYSQSVIDKDYILLKRTFREAVKKKIINQSPFDDLRRPKSKKVKVKTRALTVDEQNKMLHVLNTEYVRYGNQMLLSMLTGMRMGEVNALKVSDINFNFNAITVQRTISRNKDCNAILSETTKTKAGSRTIKFNDEVKGLLKECVFAAGDHELLFTKNNDGITLISSSMVNEVLRRTLKKYDIIDHTVPGKVTDHSFRHTFATRCIEAGMPAHVLKELLGHTDVKITLNTYCDAFDAYKEQNIDLVSEYMKRIGLTITA